jgi:subtilisin family serine protease
MLDFMEEIMVHSRPVSLVAAALAVTALTSGPAFGATAPGSRMIGINVVLRHDITPAVLSDIAKYGKVRDVMRPLDALTLQAPAANLAAIRALPYVEAANPDAVRYGSPVDTVDVTDFGHGLSTWNLDAINVTDFGFDNRVVPQDGTGVYVAVLDTGLLDSWRQYFPEERIAEEYARAFGGGGGDNGNVSTQPNKWEHDQDSHGTHVTSTILGYDLGGTPVNGVSPLATVIPVKVLNQNGSGWSSVIARGITYIANLKAGPLRDSPVVINMSLGGPVLDAIEKAAIDYAISQGVVIIASAGNRGEAGMGYPGAYAPVISVAAAGWTGEWVGASNWWYASNVPEPTPADQFYITDFSSRAKPGQDLDVAAPGSWVVGPYQLNSGKNTSHYFLGGTSMAAPHVAGIAALMLQKNPSLQQSDVETILEASAIPLPAGSRTVTGPNGVATTVSWDADASGSGLATADAALGMTP